jgi:hypothetical protein
MIMKNLPRSMLIAGLLLLTSASLAQAAMTRGPGTTINQPSVETRPTASPGDPFYPPVSNGPVANPDKAIYPKMVCWFEIVDGKVYIHWTNTGTAPLPAGSLITGTTSGGIGVSWYIPDELAPGGKLTAGPLDMNPEWFGEACKTTFKIKK